MTKKKTADKRRQEIITEKRKAARIQTSPEIEMLAVDRLVPYAKNAKKHDDRQVAAIAGSIREFGFTNPVLIDGQDGIIAGHGRVLGARLAGLEEIPCIRLAHLTDAQRRAYILADNRLAEMGGGWDADMLAAEVEAIDWAELDAFKLDDLDLGEILKDAERDGTAENGESENPYTTKIVAPIYEPKGECPRVSDLFDREKTARLIAEIERAEIPKGVAQFLKLAAERHTAFHFARIAEFYCHASPQVQDLMEKSGLVIIDFKKAIEYGFVHMTERLGKLADLEESEADDGDA